jgi:tellurite resistance protein TerC
VQARASAAAIGKVAGRAVLRADGSTLAAAGETPRDLALQFLTGYVVEKTLSIDNVFIFIVVFGFFHIPSKYQHKALFYGILGALVFRAIFIAVGAELMQYKWVVLAFGVFLIVTGIRLVFTSHDKVDPEKNWLVRLVKRFFPVTPTPVGDKFFVKQNGRWFITPLLLAVVFLEATDIVFAIDSVPAIYAITREPFIVFTSNIFAILGLRSMYFMLAGSITKFHLLKYGLSAVLVFVGLKMAWLNDVYGGHFPTALSLAIIGACIGGSIVASLLIAPRSTKALTNIASQQPIS